LIKFRRRIGEKGSDQILHLTIHLFTKKEIQEKEILIDTTVQEKNITFPTDVKLKKKIIEKCRKNSRKRKDRTSPNKGHNRQGFTRFRRKMDISLRPRYEKHFDIFHKVLLQEKKACINLM
jgi:hypothetical protein